MSGSTTTPAAVPGAVRAILFDLGGVVLDVDFERALAAWAPHSRLPPERLRESFRLRSPADVRHALVQRSLIS